MGFLKLFFSTLVDNDDGWLRRRGDLGSKAPCATTTTVATGYVNT